MTTVQNNSPCELFISLRCVQGISRMANLLNAHREETSIRQADKSVNFNFTTLLKIYDFEGIRTHYLQRRGLVSSTTKPYTHFDVLSNQKVNFWENEFKIILSQYIASFVALILKINNIPNNYNF